MALLDTVYAGTLLVSIPVIGVALYYVGNDRQRRGATSLTVLLVGTLVWLLGALIYNVAPTFRIALWTNRLQYLGIVAVPATWLLFSLVYSDRERFANRYAVGLLSVEPLVVLALVFTNRSHDLWNSAVVPEGQTYVVDGAQVTCDAVICFGSLGPGFLAHALYSYVILLAGAALVLSRALRSDAIPRGQAVSMVIAVAAPSIGNVVSLFVLPAEVPDLTPVMFGVMGVAIVVGLYRYSLVDTDALSGAVSVEDHDDPAVLVDDNDHVLALNVAAAAVLGVDADNAVRSPAEDVFDNHEELNNRYQSDRLSPGGLELEDPISGERYEVTATEVSPSGTPRGGWLYVFSPLD